MQIIIIYLFKNRASSKWLSYFISDKEFCQCTHILEVNLGDLVELVLIDEGYAYDVSHPFHLHGHSFYVVAMERHAGAPDHIGAAPHPDNYITR